MSRSLEGATINSAALVRTKLVGFLAKPKVVGSPYAISMDGHPFVPVGAGSICTTVQVGMPVGGWAGDLVEPGVSIENHEELENQALNVYACIGNRVEVQGGRADGAIGIVTGKHEHFRTYRHVLVYFPANVMEKLDPFCRFVVHAWGTGMRIQGFDDIACHSLGPELFEAWGLQVSGEGLVVPVSAVVPPELVGLGGGRISAMTSLSIQTSNRAVSTAHGLSSLHIGDVVALKDWGAKYYSGLKLGHVTIGVISTGDSCVAGHGPAVSVLLSGSAESLVAKRRQGVNVAGLLGLA